MKCIYNSLLVLGRGTGQVMLQNNALSGFLMMAGIFINSFQMGILALMGNIVSTFTAWILGYDKEDIENGLYGFNGTLVGIAAGVFMQPYFSSFMLMVVAASMSTLITRLFKLQHTIPGFTAPFILSVWMLLGVCTLFVPDMLQATGSIASKSQTADYFQALCLGIGQVMFQDNPLTGIAFLLAILVNSRRDTFYTLWGALLPIPIAILARVDAETLNMGLMGYNGVLCAIALGGKSMKDFVWASCSVVLSVALLLAGMYYGITNLTAPFVASVWIIMVIRNTICKQKRRAA